MTATTLRNRIGRLARRLRTRDPDDCPGGPTIIVDAGEPIPADAGRCPLCGAVHVLSIDEQVVGDARPTLLAIVSSGSPENGTCSHV